ncbi:MAG: hypothetical protein IK127_03765 [Clostridia bacterium]|nr:hypothetical protein [Clostridia bacterium]
MTYTTLEAQIRTLPIECLDEVSQYIEFVRFRHQQKEPITVPSNSDAFFGCLKELPDGMRVQRSARNEWN